jgi:uncharacterized protein (DUF58 family)
MNNRAFTLLLIVLGLLLAGLIARRSDPIWMALPFLAYVGLGILQSPSTGKLRILATRSVGKNGAGGSTVKIAVCNQGGETLQLRLTDPLQPGMRLAEGQTQTSAVLRAGEEARLEYTFLSGRGSFTWETARTVVSDPLGLVETEVHVPAAARVQVQPDFPKLRPFPLRPQRTLHTAGSIPARLGGRGTDFWGVREYHPGDPLRRLDWRRTARHPGQFYSKEFEQEEIADIGLILDARQKTDLRVGEDGLFEHSARAAASLAEVFLRQGNRVSLLIFGKEIEFLFPGYGKNQLHRILHALSEAVPVMNPGFDSLQFIPLHMFSSHSFIMILSPLAPEDWRLFPRLRAYGYQALLISPDPIDYARRVLPNDRTTFLATRLAQVERRLQIGKITQLWIPVVEWQVDRPLAPLVRAAIRSSHIQQER